MQKPQQFPLPWWEWVRERRKLAKYRMSFLFTLPPTPSHQGREYSSVLLQGSIYIVMKRPLYIIQYYEEKKRGGKSIPPTMKKAQVMRAVSESVLEHELCLETVLHVVGTLRSAKLLVDVADVRLHLQVVLLEVVGNGADLLALQVT